MITHPNQPTVIRIPTALRLVGLIGGGWAIFIILIVVQCLVVYLQLALKAGRYINSKVLFIALMIFAIVSDRMWKKLPSDHPAVYQPPKMEFSGALSIPEGR